MSDEPSDDVLLRAIDRLLDERREGATICPSEAARALRPDGDWRALMPRLREVADREQGAGRLVVTQRGERVGAVTARGPIRLGRPDRARHVASVT